jgi:predicted MPP superfamily phosphohydrolase
MGCELRWLHLSDFHVGKDDYAQFRLFSQILQHVAKRVEDGFAPDLVFITGDIANRGLEEEYSHFITEFLDPLQGILGTDVTQRVFMVPGNHDVNRKKNRYFDKRAIFGEGTRFFDSNSSGCEDRGIILPRFEAYSSFADKYSDSWINTAKGSYCQNLEIRGDTYSIIGINTSWLSDGCDQSWISPGIYLLEDALKEAVPSGVKFVLGHHPIDWFYQDHMEQIRLILGEHKAIYLHGHLHRSRVRIEDGYNFGFLSIQSGAAFQARDDEKWVNGIVWGELDIGSCSIRLQPRRWNPLNRDWPPSNDLPENRRQTNSDWWKYELPGLQSAHSNQLNLPSSNPFIPPNGLQLINLEFLERNYSHIDESIVLEFFNGRQPDWSLVRDSNIPKLSSVRRISQNYSSYPKTEKPHVLHVLGPTGEGKTTAVMQAIIEILGSKVKWEVLWGQATKELLALDSILSLPQDDRFWLVVIDGADIHADKIFTACMELTIRQRNDISFIICSRDTDWRAVNAHRFAWQQYSVFRRLLISGLNYEDSDALVKAWSAIGEMALGKLSGLDHETAVLQLAEAAKCESLAVDGALLGALLKVRFGDGLDNYIESLLSRLENQKINCNYRMLDAFAYIAVMHNLGLEFLSRQVLSEVLECSSSVINNHVLVPLGMESAISSDGMSILTRHREIGRRAVALLEEFDIYSDRMVVDLAEGAKNIMTRGDFLPNASNWHYTLPDRLSSMGKAGLAIEIVRLFHNSDPANLYFLIKLSSLYRDFGDPQTAARLFRDLDHLQFADNLRVVLMEWGQAEARSNNLALGLALMFLSVADFRSVAPPGYTTVMIFFVTTLNYLERLYREFPRDELREAIIALSTLGLELRLDKDSNRLFLKRLKMRGQRDSQEIDVEYEIKCVQTAVACLYELLEKNNVIVTDRICSLAGAGFNGLADFMFNVIDNEEYD